jgi:hypothetical protein
MVRKMFMTFGTQANRSIVSNAASKPSTNAEIIIPELTITGLPDDPENESKIMEIEAQIEAQIKAKTKAQIEKLNQSTSFLEEQENAELEKQIKLQKLYLEHVQSRGTRNRGDLQGRAPLGDMSLIHNTSSKGGSGCRSCGGK